MPKVVKNVGREIEKAFCESCKSCNAQMLKSKTVILSAKSRLTQPTALTTIIQPCTTQSAANEDEKEKELERIAKDASIDDPPTSCCRSGCSNCVFIAWAEALANKMEYAGPEIQEKVLKMVDDPSMKAYLEMELRLRLKNKIQ